MSLHRDLKKGLILEGREERERTSSNLDSDIEIEKPHLYTNSIITKNYDRE